MASFVKDLWESIFTPGPTPTLLVATNVTFAALQAILAVLLFATYSVHFLVLSGLSGALWWAINWFARELKVHQLREQQEEKEKARRAREGGPAPGFAATTSEESETEVEAAVASGVRREKKLGGRATAARGATPQQLAASTEVEVEEDERPGELKHRAGAGAGSVMGPPPIPSPQGTKSSASTEDEWEKVSENEHDKSQ